MKKNNHSGLFLYLIVAVLVLTSCVSRKDLAYFQDMESTSRSLKFTEKSVLKKGDILEIDIFNEDMEVTKPFNFYSLNLSDSNNTSVIKPQYLIDVEGSIDFPQIGKIKANGLTISELENYLLNKLSKFIKDPIVQVRVMNFKFSILGEVTTPGTYTVPEGRINIIQAIGMAGDLKLSAKRDNVLIIRELNSVQESYRIDLTNSEIFDNEYYYLQQNDVIVVEPNKAQIANASNTRQNFQILLSSLSFLLTVFLLISRN